MRVLLKNYILRGYVFTVVALVSLVSGVACFSPQSSGVNDQAASGTDTLGRASTITFNKTFVSANPNINSEAIMAQQTTDDGYPNGYIIVGTNWEKVSSGLDSYDRPVGVRLIHTDLSGNIAFDEPHAGLIGRALAQTSDQEYVITGWEGEGRGYLLKTLINGKQDWITRFAEGYRSSGFAVKQIGAGGFIVAGSRMVNGTTDTYLVKIDVEGKIDWELSLGGNGPAYDVLVQETTEDFVISGGAWLPHRDGSAGDSFNATLMKVDFMGNLVWKHNFDGLDYGFANTQYAWKVAETHRLGNTGYVLIGQSVPGGGGSSTYLLETDASGKFVRSRTYGGGSAHYGRSIVQTNTGNYVSAGVSNGHSASLMEIDADTLDILWSHDYGTGEAESVGLTGDDGLVLAVTSRSTGGRYSMALVKTDSNGNTNVQQSTKFTLEY